MQIDIHLLEVATGERRVLLDDYAWSDDRSVCWQFRDGNYGCDCNRFLFFHRALHPWQSGTEEPDRECGETAFRVEKIVERGTDRTIYQDPVMDDD